MIITGKKHETLSVHLFATGAGHMRQGAPQAVFTAVAALVDPADIVASHATYRHLRPTRWCVWAVTSTHLAYVEMEFNDDDYDDQEEANRIDSERFSSPHRRSPAEVRRVAAWARPLVTAVKLTVGGIDHDHTNSGHAAATFRLNQIAVEFADGTSVPAEGSLSCPAQRVEGDSDRWDEFVGAIRAGSPYLMLEIAPGPPFTAYC